MRIFLDSQLTTTTTLSNDLKPIKNNKLIVCYTTNWSQYRPEGGKFVPEDVDPFLVIKIIIIIVTTIIIILILFIYNIVYTYCLCIC
jgi:hypothetical protein